MYIYSVIRFGNEDEGADGADTEYIVLAADVEGAAKVVDDELVKSFCKRVKPFCQAVALVGESYSSLKESLILHGPILTSHSKFDLGLSDDHIWRRCEETGLGPWVLLNDF